MNLGDMVIRLGFFVLFVWLYIVSRGISRGVGGELGAAAWPQFLLIVLIFASGGVVVQEMRKIYSQRRNEHDDSINEIKTPKPSSGQNRRLAITIAISVLYILFFRHVGFIFSTTLLITGIMILMKLPSITKALIISTSVVLVISFVFGRIMFIPLPRGYWIFREISYLLY